MQNTQLPAPAVELQSKVDEERFVIQQVLHQLGRPKNLVRTIARKVWDNQYRVNVYCADDTQHTVKTLCITDSFFVTVSGQNIVSEPSISRKYE